MDRNKLSGMKVAELTELAKKHKIPVNSKTKKADLVEALASVKPASKKPAKPAAKAPARAPISTPERAPRRINLPRPQRMPAPIMAQPSPSLPGPELQLVVEESRFYTGPVHHEPWALPVELPHEYGSERISLLVRDPRWIFSYWEVTARKLEMERASLGESSLTLRLYDITGVDFDGANANYYKDTSVYDRLGNWYINSGAPGRSFIADLGLKTPDGRFVVLARSNAVRTPRDGVSDVLDEEWVLPWPVSERIFALSGGYMTGLSSADVRLAAGARVEFGVSSPGISSMALMSPAMKKQRGFWFVLNAELIVYGATEPDAKVTLQGRPVTLRPDGTFTTRFALPDGIQVIPVSATSADEVETRWITPTVSRKTN